MFLHPKYGLTVTQASLCLDNNTTTTGKVTAVFHPDQVPRPGENHHSESWIVCPGGEIIKKF